MLTYFSKSSITPSSF